MKTKLSNEVLEALRCRAGNGEDADAVLRKLLGLPPVIAPVSLEAVVGVDGARQGWLAVWTTSQQLAFEVHANVAALREAHLAAKIVAVDVPIGLSDAGPRMADVLARRFIGGRRASSVFSAPVRGVLDAVSQEEASQRHREIDGRGYGAQAFGILPKIRE